MTILQQNWFYDKICVVIPIETKVNMKFKVVFLKTYIFDTVRNIFPNIK